MLFNAAAIVSVLSFSIAVEAAPAPQFGILIATDPFFACQCPNNCDHSSGSSCKFYGGPSDSSNVVDGHCTDTADGLKCI
ncbi:hypothetical protein CC79DRAFT_1368193 [Sarocladium strictum]